MMWSYILFLPMAASLVWPVAISLFKRKTTHAQSVFSVMFGVEAIVIGMYAILYRHRSGMMLVYDYLFEVISITVPILYFLATCTLTEARGVHRHQRLAMIPAHVFFVLLTIGVLWLGRTDYEHLCQCKFMGDYSFHSGDAAYNYMLVCNVWLYDLLLLVFITVIPSLASHKMRVFTVRYDSFYRGHRFSMPTLRTRQLTVLTWAAVLLFVTFQVFLLVRPDGHIIVLSVMSVLLSVVQFLRGRCVYSFNTDAAQLALLVRKDIGAAQHIERNQPQQLRATGLVICRYIEDEGYADPSLSVDGLAVLFRLSPDAVVDSVYRQQGMPVAEYIDTVRVEHAIKDLGDPSVSDDDLERIAIACGFSDAGMLQEAFVKAVGMPIRRWIAMGGGKN